LKTKVSTNLFISFVRSKQAYAIASIADKGCGVNQTLEIAQAGTLRRCVGVPPGTSKHDIFVLSGVMPPILRAKLFTAKELFKLKAQNLPLFEVIFLFSAPFLCTVFFLLVAL